MNDCVFCQIAQHKKSADKFYEDDKVICTLDADWAVKGHSLVIWKSHYTNAADLSEKEFMYFAKIYHKAEKALLNTLRKNRALTLKTGGLINHFHFHIYPVDLDTDWQTVKKLFEKELKYEPTPSEKEDFLKQLRKQFSDS